MAEEYVQDFLEEDVSFEYDGRSYLFQPRYTAEEVRERRERALQLAEVEREREAGAANVPT